MTAEPSTIEAGTTEAWARRFDSYPSATWSLEYRLVNQASNYTIAALPNVDGVSFDAELDAATSALLAPGWYELAGYVTDGAVVHKVYTGRLEVRASRLSGEGVDTRSHARRTLDAIEATLEDRATRDQLVQTIGNRSIQRHSMDELLKLKSHYQRIVDQEEGRRAATPMINIATRFGRAS